MDVRDVQLILVLLLSVHTWWGEAVDCYSNDQCDGSAIVTGVTPQECCLLPGSIAHQSGGGGEVCKICFIYGWKGTFPREVRKGDVLNMTVGYIKGVPDIPRFFDVIFNSSDVNVSITRVDLLVDDVSVQVIVLDDGLPVTEPKTITLTLIQRNPSGSDDIFLDTAELIISPQVTPVLVSMESSRISVSEDEGVASVCVIAVSDGPSVGQVSLMDVPVTADGSDYSFNNSTLLDLNISDGFSSIVCVDVDISMDGVYEDTELFTITLTSSADNTVVVGLNVTEIMIVDFDEAVVIVEPGSAVAVEGEVIRVCLLLNNSAIPVTIHANLSSRGDFVIPETVELEPFIITCIEYTVIDDEEIEGTEQFEVMWYSQSPRVTFNPPIFQLTIEDNDVTMTPTTPTTPTTPSPPPIPPPTAPPDAVVDVITGGALLTVPIKVQSPARSPKFSTSLCYEVHGEVDEYFNLISDPCLSVNAHYSESDPTKPLNSIDEIAAVVTNNEGENLNISVDRHCNFRLNNGPALRYLNSSGVMGVATTSLVVISTDNAYCESQILVMTIECGVDTFGVLKLHVYRDLDMGGSTAHGLVGQFWSRPISIVQYGSNPDHYLIAIPGNTQRQMIGDRHSTTWQRENRQCFYVGDRQGGRGLEIKGAPNEPLIEGVYTDYIMDEPYDTSFTFSQFGK
jgi:hypothetical protein